MGWFSNNNKQAFPWVELTSEEALDGFIESSSEQPVIFFKHSTRCSISSMALSRFESNWTPNDAVTCVYLDLLNYRDLSNLLAQKSNVEHQSPQVIVFVNKEVVYTASHNGIDAKEIKTVVGI